MKKSSKPDLAQGPPTSPTDPGFAQGGPPFRKGRPLAQPTRGSHKVGPTHPFVQGTDQGLCARRVPPPAHKTAQGSYAHLVNREDISKGPYVYVPVYLNLCSHRCVYMTVTLYTYMFIWTAIHMYMYVYVHHIHEFIHIIYIYIEREIFLYKNTFGCPCINAYLYTNLRNVLRV